MTRSNVHLNGIFLEKVDILNTVEDKVIILTSNVKPNETMAMNKFQWSRLTFDLLAKVAHRADHLALVCGV